MDSPTTSLQISKTAQSEEDHNHNPSIKQMYLDMVWKIISEQLKNGAIFFQNYPGWLPTTGIKAFKNKSNLVPTAQHQIKEWAQEQLVNRVNP